MAAAFPFYSLEKGLLAQRLVSNQFSRLDKQTGPVNVLYEYEYRIIHQFITVIII